MRAPSETHSSSHHLHPRPGLAVERFRSGRTMPGSTGRPPLGGSCLRSSLSNASDAALETVDEDYLSCLIRNLDDGSEIVVREEFCLREVGTGQQLSLEEFELFIDRSPIVQELMRRWSFCTPNSFWSCGRICCDASK
jgi:WD repeat-containing protein 44